MRYIAVLLIAGATYLYLAHQAPVKQAVDAVTQSPTPGTDFLKAPLDRTHEVLDQARNRAADPALQ
ncbi:MAG: hypothetical protein ABSE62_02545 [Chthoniobacteraceae bacterium]|jgi:hypothetical protein